MKLAQIMTAVMVALCGILAVTWFIDMGGSAGYDHPTIAQLSVGGPGDVRHGPIFVIGWLYGALIITFFVCAMALGASKAGRLSPGIRNTFVAGYVIYLFIYTMMFRSYHAYMEAGGGDQFLALPIPTAWMIYGLWAAPMFFIAVYVLIFDRWTYTDADRAKFAELMEERRRRGEGPA